MFGLSCSKGISCHKEFHYFHSFLDQTRFFKRFSYLYQCLWTCSLSNSCQPCHQFFFFKSLTFMRKNLIKNELKFPLVKSHALVIVVSLRKFRHYVLGNLLLLNFPSLQWNICCLKSFCWGKWKIDFPKSKNLTLKSWLLILF